MAMKLIEALEVLRKGPSEDSGPFAVSLVCSFTPLHLQTLLAAQLQLLDQQHHITLHTGLYGDLVGNLAKAVAAKSDAAVVIVEWEDLDPRLGIRSLGGWVPDVLPNILDNVKDRSATLANAIESVSQGIPLVVCFPTLPLPPISYTPGWQAGAFETELWTRVSAIASQVVHLSNVKLLNSQRLDLLSPAAERFDVKSELLAGFPYRISHAGVMAELLARLVLSPAPKKGLITDLDDTVWKGILGEVGVDGISWDLDHNSQMHAVYQQLLHALSKAGVLVGVASKNDASLVDEVFGQRSPILPKEAVFPIEAGWGLKSQSVGRILKAWNVGPEAVVFVDDSPIELAEVKAAYPAIECIFFPQDDPQAIYLLLQRLRDIFGKSLLQEEDAIRLDSLRHRDSTHRAG